MSAPAFTPGKWFAVDRGRKGEPMMSVMAERIAGRGPSHEVAICATGDSPQAMETANANLIAASPDLYAALSDATDALDYVHAIDSVTPPECDPDDGLCGAQFCAQNGCLVRKIAVARAALAKAQGAQS